METSSATQTKTAGGTTGVLQLVTFALNNEEYAVDILSAQEINRITDITKVPNAPRHVEGVINLRGRVIPVINLRRKFGFPEKVTDDTSRIVIMEIAGVTTGVIVDSVSEVLRIPSDVVEPAPPLSSATNSQFITGLAKLENRLIILLDTDRLMEEPA